MAETGFQWTQDSWEPEAEVTERRVASRNERLAWFGVIALAVVAFEVTADPALTVSLGCLKFGWDEFQQAVWLKRTDPDRRRGDICSRFYLAWGLWRVSLVAVAAFFLIAIIFVSLEDRIGKLRGAPGPPPPGFESALLIAFGGFFGCSLVSSFAVFSALKSRTKVWIGPEVRWAREQNVWPPQAAHRRKVTTNRTKAILLSGLITAITIPLMGVILLFINIFLQRQAPPKNSSVVIFMTLFVVSLVGVAFALLVLLEMLGRRMIAPSPEACWAEPSPLESSKDS